MKIGKILFSRLLATTFCMALIWPPCKASAQWLGFLRLDGVVGEVADTNHIGWMNVASASTSNVTNSNHLSKTPLCFEKSVDKASPVLKVLCAQGTTISTGTFDLAQTNATLAQFLRLNLTNVLVSSASNLGNPPGENRPLEDICLSAQVISWNYTRFSPTSGLPQSYSQSIWNFQNNNGSGGTTNSLFVVSGIRRTSGVELMWPATPGKTYRIYGAPDLGGTFTPLSEISAPAGGGNMMTNSQPLNSPAMFFVVEQAP